MRWQNKVCLDIAIFISYFAEKALRQFQEENKDEKLTRLFLYIRFISSAENLGLAFRSPLLPPSVLMLPIDPHQRQLAPRAPSTSLFLGSVFIGGLLLQSFFGRYSFFFFLVKNFRVTKLENLIYLVEINGLLTAGWLAVWCFKFTLFSRKIIGNRCQGFEGKLVAEIQVHRDPGTPQYLFLFNYLLQATQIGNFNILAFVAFKLCLFNKNLQVGLLLPYPFGVFYSGI